VRIPGASRLLSLAGLLLAAAGLLAPAPAWAKKKVSIEWKAIKGAVAYEIQFNRGEQVLDRQMLKAPAWSGELPFGFLSYQIRAYDRVKRPGVWSPPLALVVMPKPPELKEPADGRKYQFYGRAQGVKLAWAAVDGANRYKVRLTRDKDTVVYEDLVAQTSLELPKLPPGDYEWQVTAVFEPGRGIASLEGKRWESKPSDPADFTLEREELEAPTPLSPKGTLVPPKSGRLPFSWKAVEGAEAYAVTVREIPKEGDSGPRPREIQLIAKGTALVAELAKEGQYSWQVRALAALSPENVPEAESPRSSAEFKLDRNAEFTDGAGYVALSTMLAPYSYQSSVNGGAETSSATAVSATVRASGEYWVRPQFGIAAGYDRTLMLVQLSTFYRTEMELLGRYRGVLKGAWFISPKAGLTYRDYLLIRARDPRNPDVGAYGETFSVLGPTVGLDIRRQFTPGFSMGLKTAYFMPLASSTAGGVKLSGASLRNLTLGIQGMWWMGGAWGFGAGLFAEQRSLAYASPSRVQADEINMDAIYFFGSLVYSFGR
jgi:hypothetical protein